jgi:hypothetical protein
MESIKRGTTTGMAASPLVRVDVKYIIQGVTDRTDSTSYGVGVEQQEVKFLASKWWENDNETLMKVVQCLRGPTICESG